MGSRRVGYDWVSSLSLFTLLHWRRKWQPIPVFLPGESQGQKSLVGCCLWGSNLAAAAAALNIISTFFHIYSTNTQWVPSLYTLLPILSPCSSLSNLMDTWILLILEVMRTFITGCGPCVCFQYIFRNWKKDLLVLTEHFPPGSVTSSLQGFIVTQAVLLLF